MLVHILDEAYVHVEDVDGGVGLHGGDVLPEGFYLQFAGVHAVGDYYYALDVDHLLVAELPELDHALQHHHYRVF